MIAAERRPARGYLLAAGCAACAGGAIVVGKLAVGEAHPLLFNLLLFTFGMPLSALMTVAVRQWRRPDRRTALLALGHSSLSFVAVWSFWAGVSRIDASLASFLNRAETLVAVAVGVLFLRERFHRMELVGGLLAVAGIIVMSLPEEFGAPDPRRTEGIVLMLVGASVFGISEVFSKRAAQREMVGPFLILRNAFLIVFFAIAVVVAGKWQTPSNTLLAGTLGVAVLAPTTARMLFLLSLRHVDLAKAAIINQGQPLVAAVLAMALLHERRSMREWCGGAVLLIGCALLAAAARGGGADPATA